ncbi:MAG: hypothetical protein D6725_09425 [Planctomycetota bacterium]|nr:MAG: hypothetical protein D6725_09425 [Planctomycetota bacterium]
MTVFHGVTALLHRAVREAALKRRHHLLRLATAFFLLVLLVTAHSRSSTWGAPGLYYFARVSTLNVVLVTLAGIGLFAPCIVEEREQGTLPLLLLAGIDPLGVILGKAGGRLFVGLTLLAVQIPFGALAVALGGLLLDQALAAYAVLAAYLLLAAAWGTAVSAMTARSATASLLTAVGLIVFLGSPWLLMTSASGFVGVGWVSSGSAFVKAMHGAAEWLEGRNVVLVLQHILNASAAASGWRQTAGSYVFTAAVLLGISWWLLRKDVYGEGWLWRKDRASRTRSREVSAMVNKAVDAMWVSPVMWKEFRVLGGGWKVFVTKCVLYPLLFAGFHWEMQTYRSLTRGFHDYWELMFLIFSAMVALEWLFYAARLFGDELGSGGWSVTSTLPMSLGRVAFEKLLGCLWAGTPTLVAVAVAGSQISTEWKRLVTDANRLSVLFAVLLFWHLVVLTSLYVRRGSLVLSTAIVVLAGTLLFPLLLSAATTFAAYGGDVEPVAAVLYCGISLTVLLQFCIWTRLRYLAAVEG